MMSTNSEMAKTDAAEAVAAGTTSYPEVASPTDSVIAGDFGAMSAEEQERQRQEWKDELAKTEEEILTLKQVLHSKEAHAAGLKRRLGITAWREFSEDMTQGLKNIQDSTAYKKTAEGLNQAGKKTAELWSSVTHSHGFQSMSDKVNSAFGAARNRISASMSSHNVGQVYNTPATSTNVRGDTDGTAVGKETSATDTSKSSEPEKK